MDMEYISPDKHGNGAGCEGNGIGKHKLGKVGLQVSFKSDHPGSHLLVALFSHSQFEDMHICLHHLPGYPGNIL